MRQAGLRQIARMNKLLLVFSLAAGFLSTPAPARETLQLKLEPDRDYCLSGPPQEVVVKIDVSAVTDRKTKRTPLNLAVVLDRSGSMAGPKIEKAKQAAMLVVDRLAPDDIFSLVVYDERVDVLVPAQRVEDKEALRARIERISPGGNTALHAGVRSGANQIREFISAKRINRVILLSDGLANVGPSSPRDLRKLGRDLARDDIAVTTIGVGDDYNEDLMSGLAEASDANYYYVKDAEKLPEIFAKELGELLAVCARDVRIEITCPEGVKPLGFIGRTEQFDDGKAVVRLNQFSPGQDRYLFLRCRIDGTPSEVARASVHYRDELNGGGEQNAAGTVRIRFTTDRALAAGSMRPAIVAEKELLVTAVVKDESLVAADAGKTADAAKKLAGQADALRKVYSDAPAAAQSQIRLEINNLTTRSQQMTEGQYSSGTRKSMQWESYNMRNAKQNDQ
jgi:Ca-activated chloride channel family protein